MEEEKQQLNYKRNLYIDFLKTTVRILFSDPEIIMMDYIISKIQDGINELEEEDLTKGLKIDKKTVSSALHGLIKSGLINKKEKKNNNKGQKNKIYSFQLNEKLRDEFDDIILRINLDIKNKNELECLNCKKQYSIQDVFGSNPRLVPGKFVCLNQFCKSFLQSISEENKMKNEEKIKKQKQLIEQIKIKLEKLKDVEWPWKKIINNDLFERPSGNNFNNEENRNRIDKRDIFQDSLKLKSLKKRVGNKYDFNFENLLANIKLHENIINFVKEEQTKKAHFLNETSFKSDKVHRKIPIFLQNRKKFKDLNDIEYDLLFKKKKI